MYPLGQIKGIHLHPPLWEEPMHALESGLMISISIFDPHVALQELCKQSSGMAFLVGLTKVDLIDQPSLRLGDAMDGMYPKGLFDMLTKFARG